MLANSTSPEESKELLRLCRAGRLYEIEKWIAAGKSLAIPTAKHGTLLQVAVETGFHSLIELIAKHENDQSSRNAALADAVASHRLDFVQLIVEHGAEVKSVPLADVLLEWNPQIVRFFLDHGANPLEGSPFAVAFGQKIRTALGIFVEYKRAHPELSAALLEQANCALRYFCDKGDMKWISLLLWAGADARAAGPTLEKEYTNDPECFTTGLTEASYSGNVEVLKKLKPDAARDNLGDLLRCAAVGGHSGAIRYLLEIGANPNDKENGGSSALDACLWRLSFGDFNPFGGKSLRSKYQVSKALDSIRELVPRGAIWNPAEKRALNDLRRNLCGCEPEVTIELLKVLLKHNACPAERLRELLSKPQMKEHLASQSWHLRRLGLHYEETRALQRRLPSPGLLRQYNREELYERVWSEPARNVARLYGISDVGLGKVCRALWIPVPGRGYWAKKSAGKPTRKRPPLPALPDGGDQQRGN